MTTPPPGSREAAAMTPSTETLEAIHRAWVTRNVALKAYREAVGVGVIGDSAVALVALMATNRPEYKALEKARDELRSLATAHAGDLVEEIWRLRAAVNALPELLAKVKRYESLIRAMIENEPDDIVADGGHTVLDEWRYNARALLETKP
jgi:hypothetical protein